MPAEYELDLALGLVRTKEWGVLTDDDLRAIFIYLKTIPPVDNAAPQAKINPPPAVPAAAS